MSPETAELFDLHTDGRCSLLLCKSVAHKDADLLEERAGLVGCDLLVTAKPLAQVSAQLLM